MVYRDPGSESVTANDCGFYKEVMIFYKIADLPDVTSQVAGVLILQGRRKSLVMMTYQEFNGLVPTMVGQVLSGRIIIPFRTQVPGF